MAARTLAGQIESASGGGSPTRVVAASVEVLTTALTGQSGRTVNANVEVSATGDLNQPVTVQQTQIDVLLDGEKADSTKVYAASVEVLSVPLYRPPRPERDNFEPNPYRPFIPDELITRDPVLYDFMKEQIETLRRQHNITQAGDTTYPWTLLVDPNDEPMFTLGSLGRFFHPLFGLLVARYVQFDSFVDARWLAYPVGLLKNQTQVDWKVTNELSLSAPELLVGVGFFLSNPKSGQYGWVVVQGANLTVCQLQGFDDARPFAKNPKSRLDQSLTWTGLGQLGFDGTGKEAGRFAGPVNGTLAPMGSIYVDIQLWSPGRISKSLEGPLADIQARIADLTERVELVEDSSQIPALWSAVGQLQTKNQALEVRFANEELTRRTVDDQLWAAVAELQSRDDDYARLGAELTELIQSTAAAQDIRIDQAQARADAAYALAASINVGAIESSLAILNSAVGDVNQRLGSFRLDPDGIFQPGDQLYYDSTEGFFTPRPVFSGTPVLGSIHGEHLFWRLAISQTDDGQPARIGLLEFRATPDAGFDSTDGTPLADSEVSGHEAALAFDDDAGTYWEATSEATWIQWEFPDPIELAAIDLSPDDQESPTGRPVKAMIQWSDDGSAWTDAWEIDDSVAWDEVSPREYQDPEWNRTAEPSRLSWIGDVDLTTPPADGDRLVFNATTQTWLPAPAPDLSGYVAKSGSTMTGALGIGIVPAFPFDLMGTGVTVARMQNADSTDGIRVVVNSATVQLLFGTSEYSGRALFGSTTDHGVSIVVNSVERLILTNDGGGLLGTFVSDLASRWRVASGDRSFTFSAISNDWNYFSSSGAPIWFGTGDNQPLRFYTNSVHRGVLHDSGFWLDVPLALPNKSVSSLPAASNGAGQLIYVSDEVGGACVAFSDGVNWRRVYDNAICS